MVVHYLSRSSSCFCFFFFQAEDGIRDDLVTGVQTCALPIYVEGKPVRLLHSKDTPIKRHIKRVAEANPFDRNDELYFEQRQIKLWKENKLQQGKLRLIWERQNHRCLICGQMFKDDEDWDIHHIVRTTDGGGDEAENLMMLHPNCHRQL